MERSENKTQDYAQPVDCLVRPIFKFLTSKPKDIVSSTTMKPILNIKSNDRDYHGNKNRICNGRKLFRTSGSKRGVSNDQMDEN
ncbi:hypothetical protein DERF_012648 [Dermatophagoides farinae]|uniref:Uncharacterized protein n=1 Tax=Dermatophagoides farinae TaxID=6954 RepID=A0A922HPY9_DERFA|nr:hypothetical protein DERF_012648 [Dermatophagoides farinae]